MLGGNWRMRFFRHLLMGLVVVGGLAGCALSPQELNPNPVITASLPKTGHGQTINLVVEDHRSSPVIGMRGGIYSNTSTVSIQSKDLLSKLKAQTEKALKDMGYQPQSGSGSSTLTLAVDSISYKPVNGWFTDDVVVKAALSARLQTASKTYNGKYTSSITQEYASSPSLEKNNDLLSRLLTNVLTNVFSDSKLSGSM